MDWLIAGCGLLAVVGVPFFLAYCGKAFDAEAAAVERAGRR